MSVIHLTPFSIEKDLGKAYNQAMSLIPENDWACLRDQDTMFLTPDAGNIIFNYAYQNTGTVLTCYTNRIHSLAKEQIHPSSNFYREGELLKLIEVAQKQRALGLTVSQLTGSISGFLMLIPKSIWAAHPFKEGIGLLGVDTEWFKRIREAGVKVLRMNGLYIYHLYRLGKDIKDTSHLKL